MTSTGKGEVVGYVEIEEERIVAFSFDYNERGGCLTPVVPESLLLDARAEIEKFVEDGDAMRNILLAENEARVRAEALAAELTGLLKNWHDEHMHRHRATRSQAPGHCHDVRGVWDSDNGVLAGKPCALCQLWDIAIDARAAGSGEG